MQDRTSWPQRMTVVVGLGTCASAVILSILAMHILPNGDYWAFLAQRGMGQNFDAIRAQNKYHLMLLPRVIFVLDEMAGWGGLHHILSYATALLSLAAIALAGAAAIRKDERIEPTLRLPLAATSAAFALSATHIEALAEPQKLWIPMATAGCVLALHLASRSCRDERGRIAFPVAMILIVAATLSGVIGLLCLPVLALLIVLLRGGLIRLVGLALASAVAAGLFYTHMDLPPPSGALRLALSDPVPVLLALGRFFGAPLARILGGSPLAAQALPAAEALGLAGTAMAAGFWLSFLRAPRQNAPAALWLGILALALIWGGSVSIRDAVEPGPVLSRYDLIVSLFWSALVVLTVRRMPGFGSGPLLGLAMMLLVLQFPFGLRAIAQAEIVAATRIALAVGVDDPAIEARRGYGEDMARVRPLLLARALPPFNDEAARAVGSAQSPMADGPSCAAGQVNEAVSLPTGGLRLLGQGGVPKGPFLLRIIDSDGQLSGLGERWRGPADLFGRASEPEGWLAYLRPNAKPPFHLLAIGQDGAACRILSRQ